MVRNFFDTNILLYLLSDDGLKADKAEALLAEGGIVSVQVLNEFAAVAHRKTKLPWPEIRVVLATVRAACRVVPLTTELHEEALSLAERYGFTLYDSLIVAAARGSGCGVLYSEDLQHGQDLGVVTVVNPFAVH